MKNFFIIFSIMVVGILAFMDAKTRMEELDNVAATTPAQVEMKMDAPKSTGIGIKEKTENSRTFEPPQNQNNNPKVQNIPQKLNPQFKPSLSPNQSP